MPLLPSPELQFCDGNGLPYAAGTLATYVVGTTTLKSTWADYLATVLNTNPVVLDSAGRCILWGDGQYRLVLKDALGNLIWDQVSATEVSAAMAAVCMAPTVAAARTAMGIDDAIAAEATLRANADTAEIAARQAADAAEVTARNAAIAVETNRALAAEAALAAEIAAIPGAVAVAVQGGFATTGSDGHVRITFPTPFASACTAVSVTMIGSGFFSSTSAVTSTTTGLDVWLTQAGSPIPRPNATFSWMALGH
jgi:hypothetical protein